MGGLVPDVEDKELRDKFYSFGEIASIKARGPLHLRWHAAGRLRCGH